MLGLAASAKAEAIANFTAYGGERFKWFWKQGHDAEPDMDNGGAGMSILQLMLEQTLGDRLLVFPAWPKDWNVDFKLRAPGDSVVRGVYRDGRIERLDITPGNRGRYVRQDDATIMGNKLISMDRLYKQIVRSLGLNVQALCALLLLSAISPARAAAVWQWSVPVPSL